MSVLKHTSVNFVVLFCPVAFYKLVFYGGDHFELYIHSGY